MIDSQDSIGEHSGTTDADASENVAQAQVTTESPQESGSAGVGFAELQAMQSAYTALASLDTQSRKRTLTWLTDTLGFAGTSAVGGLSNKISEATMMETRASNSLQEAPSAKEFVSQKKPESAVERVACLAYYLTNYRDMQHFKTADIVALSLDAAMTKFANPSRDVDRADRHAGYIVPAGNGAKQITVRGEAVVEALPSREAVKSALAEYPHRRKRSSSATKKATPSTADL